MLSFYPNRFQSWNSRCKYFCIYISCLQWSMFFLQVNLEPPEQGNVICYDQKKEAPLYWLSWGWHCSCFMTKTFIYAFNFSNYYLGKQDKWFWFYEFLMRPFMSAGFRCWAHCMGFGRWTSEGNSLLKN